MTALAHKVTWQAPRPLWRGTTPFQARPQLLRFASDDFMEQLLATLAEEPARISDRIARPETWRDPPMPADLLDAVVRVPIPAPMQEAKRRRFWRAAPSAPPPAPPANKQLKLYQPAHQRYYLVAGTLACQIPGLPERAVEGGHETVGFVMRRLLPASGRADGTLPLVEYAYVMGSDGPEWQRVEADAGLAPGEEQLPLFPLQHRDEEGARRTIWAGMIPVARREEYLGKSVVTTPVSLAAGQMAALKPGAPAARPVTKVARTAQLRIEVIEPWKALVRAAIKAADEFRTNTPDSQESNAERAERVRDYNYQYQHQSWLLLLDLRKWLDLHLPRVAARLSDTTQPPDSVLNISEQAAWRAMHNLVSGGPIPPAGKTKAPSMRDAVRRILAWEPKLDAVTTHYADGTKANADWPDFHFQLVGMVAPPNKQAAATLDGPYKTVLAGGDPFSTTLDPPANDETVILDPVDSPDVNVDVEKLDRFLALLARALPDSDEATVQPIPHAMKLRDVMIKTAGDQGLFVARMVHMNADCGPLHPPTLSKGSEQFRLASFFDPDAPVRPITITLPTDTSPAGLRKHGRGTAFVMSDLLCGQVQRAKGFGFIDLVLQVLPWPFHKSIKMKKGAEGGGCKGGSNVDIGMICSLSIPIITICALILLICIVLLLDFIFRWVPWFIACFPLPRFKGKA
ncbi:hypothetical protein RZN05_04975 [Sphingomonas sp. HF-S4]|uniref:Uncharacterized protein n=1 Tax=Sphingomonas agrestis TaxID=3080540 RepID=A0ABU3Y5H8_9SPHN|nr:hypothetical protein [Sphingomonas sp. HF-S4]MDV3456327.1 hypothetical protein [Sphingomonas sp. HF-S4]